jgi:hypothetical protein
MQSVVMRTGHIARNAGCAGIDEAGFAALADFYDE